MTVKLELPPDIEARYQAEARARGVSFDEFVKVYLIQHAPPAKPVPLSPEHWDNAFDEIASLIPEGVPPLSDEAISRESIYTREDEW